MAPAHLLSAVDLDLEHDVDPRRGVEGRGAHVVAEELRPFEEPARRDALLEGLPCREHVRVVGLADALGAASSKSG